MRAKYRVLFSAIAILAATLLSAEVKTDYDRSVDFGRYKTYSDKSEKNIQRLDRDLQKMFEHFPPDVRK